MTRDELKQFLLRNLDNAKEAAGGRQIVCRCHFCNDTKQHLNIGRFDDSSEPLFYNCYRCPASGILDKNFFIQYDLDIDKPTLEDIVNSNKGSSYRTYKKGKEYSYFIKNNFISENKLSELKLKYINNRIGTNLSYQDCMNLKIVLNLEDLLTSNNIKSITRHVNIVKQLNSYFIGFISRTNSSINMRNLVDGKNKVYDNIDKRYVNYNIFNTTFNDDYYVIPTQFDINRHLKVYVSEGPFDILSVYLNLISDRDNTLFIAGKGKAYLDIIEFLISTYGLYDFEVHYFVDKDVSDYYINTICNYITPFNLQFYIHRNIYNDEKDYGVPKDRIIDSIRRVK